MGTRGSFPGVKQPGCEADHSLPSSAEVKNSWSYTSTPQCAFMAWCTAKAQGQLDLLLHTLNLWFHMRHLTYSWTKVSFLLLQKIMQCKRYTNWAIKSHYSSVGIVLGYRLDDWGFRVQFLTGAGNFSLHHCIQNSSRAHPASYPLGIKGSFPGGEAASAWNWPLTSI
jgi:hypothetical protein